MDHASQDLILDDLVKEIQDEVLTPKELESLLENYLLQHGKHAMWSKKKVDTILHGIPTSLDAHHIICRSCGKRSV